MDWCKGRKGDTHYPVPGNFTVGKRAGKNIGSQRGFIYARINAVPLQLWTQAAVDGIQGCDSKINSSVDTRLHIPTASGHVRLHCRCIVVKVIRSEIRYGGSTVFL
jgi:hypothetical protein